jgi:hypothetical protein
MTRSFPREREREKRRKVSEREGARVGGDAWWEEKFDRARYNPEGLLTLSVREADAWAASRIHQVWGLGLRFIFGANHFSTPHLAESFVIKDRALLRPLIVTVFECHVTVHRGDDRTRAPPPSDHR